MISNLSSGFKVFKNGRLNKAFFYVHFEGLTNDLYFGKTRPPGGSHIEKGFFNTLLMRKHDF